MHAEAPCREGSSALRVLQNIVENVNTQTYCCTCDLQLAWSGINILSVPLCPPGRKSARGRAPPPSNLGTHRPLATATEVAAAATNKEGESGEEAQRCIPAGLRDYC